MVCAGGYEFSEGTRAAYELIDAAETKRRYPFFKKLPEKLQVSG